MKYEVMYYFKNKVEFIEITTFILSIFLLIQFGLRNFIKADPDIAVAILWLSLISGTTLGSVNLFERDSDSGRLGLYQLLPITLETVIFSKWAALYFLMLLPLLLLIPVWAMLLAIPSAHWLQLAVGLAAGAGGITTLSTLAAGLLAGHGRGAYLLSLVTMPLVIPLMIFGTFYCRQIHLGDPSLLFLGGFWFLMLPATCFAVAASIRASN